jgi:hypothetical protein
MKAMQGRINWNGSWLVAWTIAFLGSALPGPASGEVPTKIAVGKISLPEISGALMLGDRLLVAADDAEDEKDDVKKWHMIALLGDAQSRLQAGGEVVVEEKEQIYQAVLAQLGQADADFVTDLEDVALLPSGEVYLISSQSRSQKDKFSDKRQRC